MLIAQETLDIYSPLANRLGLSSVKRELEDLALRYTKPEIYYKLVEQVAKKIKEREKYASDVQGDDPDGAQGTWLPEREGERQAQALLQHPQENGET